MSPTTFIAEFGLGAIKFNASYPMYEAILVRKLLFIQMFCVDWWQFCTQQSHILTSTYLPFGPKKPYNKNLLLMVFQKKNQL